MEEKHVSWTHEESSSFFLTFFILYILILVYFEKSNKRIEMDSSLTEFMDDLLRSRKDCLSSPAKCVKIIEDNARIRHTPPKIAKETKSILIPSMDSYFMELSERAAMQSKDRR